jgi:hypothetical protein
MTTQAAQVACFCNVAGHLEPGGCFVVEVGVPDLRMLPPGQNVVPFQVSPGRPAKALTVHGDRNERKSVYERPRGSPLGACEQVVVVEPVVVYRGDAGRSDAASANICARHGRAENVDISSPPDVLFAFTYSEAVCLAGRPRGDGTHLSLSGRPAVPSTSDFAEKGDVSHAEHVPSVPVTRRLTSPWRICERIHIVHGRRPSLLVGGGPGLSRVLADSDQAVDVPDGRSVAENCLGRECVLRLGISVTQCHVIGAAEALDHLVVGAWRET